MQGSETSSPEIEKSSYRIKLQTMGNITYIGIDGGISGALSVVRGNELIEQILMPVATSDNGRNEYDVQLIIEFLEKYPDATILLEKAQFTPKLGGIASFSFGKSYGVMIGILSALKRKYHIIAARTWQKEIFRDINVDDTKAASVLIAKRLYPNASFLPTDRSKKIHTGLTDSVLIAEYGRRKLL